MREGEGFVYVWEFRIGIYFFFYIFVGIECVCGCINVENEFRDLVWWFICDGVFWDVEFNMWNCFEGIIVIVCFLVCRWVYEDWYRLECGCLFVIIDVGLDVFFV